MVSPRFKGHPRCDQARALVGSSRRDSRVLLRWFTTLPATSAVSACSNVVPRRSQASERSGPRVTASIAQVRRSVIRPSIWRISRGLSARPRATQPLEFVGSRRTSSRGARSSGRIPPRVVEEARAGSPSRGEARAFSVEDDVERRNRTRPHGHAPPRPFRLVPEAWVTMHWPSMARAASLERIPRRSRAGMLLGRYPAAPTEVAPVHTGANWHARHFAGDGSVAPW